MLIQVDSH